MAARYQTSIIHLSLVLFALILWAMPAVVPAAWTQSWESDIRFSFIGDSNFKRQASVGDASEYNFNTRDVLSLQATEGVLLRLGAEFDRNQFDRPSGSPIPGALQATSLVIGADFQLGEAWLIRIEAQPGFYSASSDYRAEDFNVPVVVGGVLFLSTDLQIVAGVSMDLDRKYPVLPGLGLRWKINADWTLNAVLPTPRIEYQYSPSFLLYAGADIRQSTYRTDSRFGTSFGKPKLDNAVLDYMQIRTGAGLSWKVTSEIAAELEAGVVPMNELYFHRAGERVHSTGVPPYAGLAIKARF